MARQGYLAPRRTRRKERGRTRGRSEPYAPECVEGVFSEVTGRGVYALRSGSEWEERSVHGFLDGLVRSTKTVMTRVELGGTLFLVAVIAVLLTSREEGDEQP